MERVILQVNVALGVELQADRALEALASVAPVRNFFLAYIYFQDIF